MATYVGDRIYAYKNLLKTPSVVYTNTTDLVTGMTLYDSTGVDIGERIGDIVDPSSFDLDPIKYISMDGTTFNFNLNYLPSLYAIGKDWINVTKNYSYKTYHIDLSTGTPTFTEEPYGQLSLIDGYISSNNGLYLGTFHRTEAKGYKLRMDNATGLLTVELTDNKLLGITENALVGLTSEISGNNRILHIYWNGVEKYILPPFSKNATSYMHFAQVANDTLMIYNSRDPGSTYRITESGYTAGTDYIRNHLSANNLGDKLTTHDYIINSKTPVSGTKFVGNTIYKRSTSTPETISNEYSVDSDTFTYAFGVIGDYVYCIQMSGWDATAKNWTTSSVVKLVLLTVSDLTKVYEKILPNDPFNEYEGIPTFWYTAMCYPSKSYTGYVGIGGYNSTTNKYNVVQIAQML
jgi:hypothetical protein